METRVVLKIDSLIQVSSQNHMMHSVGHIRSRVAVIESCVFEDPSWRALVSTAHKFLNPVSANFVCDFQHKPL